MGITRPAAAFAGLNPRLSGAGHIFLRKARHKTARGKRFRERLAAADKPPRPKPVIGAMMRNRARWLWRAQIPAKPFGPALRGGDSGYALKIFT